MLRAPPVTKRTGTLPLAKRLRASSQLDTWELGSLLFSCVPVGFGLREVTGLDVADDASATRAMGERTL